MTEQERPQYNAIDIDGLNGSGRDRIEEVGFNGGWPSLSDRRINERVPHPFTFFAKVGGSARMLWAAMPISRDL